MSTGNATTKPSAVGDRLTGFDRVVTQERVEAYAAAAHDLNPVHMDDEYAAGTPVGQRIAHGMLTLAFVAEMLASNFPETWHDGGRIKARFKNPVFFGERVSIFGEITDVRETPNGRVAICSVGCRRPDGSEAVSGTATAPLR